MAYYDKNAEDFYNNTVDVDMQPLYEAFIRPKDKVKSPFFRRVALS